MPPDSLKAADPPGYPRPVYAWYVVAVLTLVYVFSFIDRQVLNLMVRPIRRDLAISDTQMSLLMGFSFAVFYTFFGILMGRLADSRSRRGLIAAGFVLWSMLTAGCGLARNYLQMLVLRMGVGVGEATLSPAAYSLISDYFPPRRLATVISVYSMGIYIGTGLAYLLGGTVVAFATEQAAWQIPVIGATRPWQVIFFMVGLPGVFLVALMATIREPQRFGRHGRPVGLRQAASFWLANRRTFLCHNVGFALLSFSSYGAAAWIPTFFVRHHGWSAAKIGVWFGLTISVLGTLGVVAGGRFADWLASRGHRDATMRVGFIVSLAWLPAGMFIYLVPGAWLALSLQACAQIFSSAPFGVAAAAIQQVAPPNLRGQASAIYLFIVNLIGLGLGPTAVALATDYLFADDNMVGYSLLVVTTSAHIFSALLLWTGLKPFAASRQSLAPAT